jgi:hypothetical protein
LITNRICAEHGFGTETKMFLTSLLLPKYTVVRLLFDFTIILVGGAKHLTISLQILIYFVSFCGRINYPNS